VPILLVTGLGCPANEHPEVLLLGDSISIGYTDGVRELLADRVARSIQPEPEP